MNTVPTYRHGRKYYKADGDARGLTGFCNVLFLIALLSAPPVAILLSEGSYHRKIMALYSVVENGVSPISHTSKVGDLIHFTSGEMDDANECTVTSHDEVLNISVPGALNLKRKTEYCQWSESKTKVCDRCTREVSAKDGSSKTESYDCNCILQYHYTKSWRPYMISSMLFDQPAAHHNPQRDPYPPTTLTSEQARFVMRKDISQSNNNADNDSDLSIIVPRDLLKNTRAPYRTIDWVPNGIPPPPSLFSRILRYLRLSSGVDTVRYEPLSQLKGTETSPASVSHNFAYVGQGGYFFSPLQSSKAQDLFKYMMEYLEGSLLDWQLGDLMPSCTAGDIRISYAVQDPHQVSVLAQIESMTENTATLTSFIPTPIAVNNYKKSDVRLGLIYEGDRSVQEMIETEQYDSFFQVSLFRCLLLIWAIPISRLLAAFQGKSLGHSTYATNFAALATICSFALASTWLFYWGFSLVRSNNHDLQILMAFLGSICFGFISMRHVKRAESKSGGIRAVWCMIGRWANLPPEWRMEESYVNRLEEVKEDDDDKKS